MDRHKDWPLVPLKQITLKIGSGATPRGGKNSYKAEGISLIRSLNVYDFIFDYNGLAYIDEDQAKGLSNVEVERNDILLNITGASVARCCIVPNKVLPARVNQHVAIVRIDPNLANPHFVLNILNSPRYKHHLLTLAQGGATREALTKEKIEYFEIPLPPLNTQRKIAAVLSAYDDLIENNTRRIQILEEMAQAIYRQWFVEFKFPGHEDVPLVNSGTELVEIPEGWCIRNLFEIADVTYGYGFKSKLFTTEPTEIPVVRIRDIPKNSTETYTTEKVTANYLIEDGDILVGMDGNFHMCKWAGGNAYLNQRVARFRPLGDFPRYLLFLLLKTPIEYLNSTIVGTTVAHLGDRHLKTIHCVVPEKATLERSRQVLEPLYYLEISLRKKNSNLRTTRDLLLPKLVSREVDVSEMNISTDSI